MQKKCLNYPVEFIEDAFGESSSLADLIRKATGGENPRVMLVADQNLVMRTEGFGLKIGKYLKEHGIDLAGRPVLLPGGEMIKSDEQRTAMLVETALLDAKLGQGDVVMAIGGGTVLDVAGYASAQVRGGLKLLRMPTTPAAMFDAAFAEYAALDAKHVKNAFRIPSAPAAVVLDVQFAKTIVDAVWRGGFGEIVRHLLVQDATCYKKFEKLLEAYLAHDLKALAELLEMSVALRSKKGGTDFALWPTYRLESMSDYKLPHGYAVPIGICMEVSYAVARGLMKQTDGDHVIELLKSSGALDGLSHSRHIVGQADAILFGLDAWSLSTGDRARTLPTGLGKSTVEEEPDINVYRKTLKSFNRSISLEATTKKKEEEEAKS